MRNFPRPSRKAGVSLAVLLGGMLLRSLPIVGLIMPWVLPDVAGVALAAPQKLLLTPVVLTGLWSLLFAFVGFWAFGRVEL